MKLWVSNYTSELDSKLATEAQRLKAIVLPVLLANLKCEYRLSKAITGKISSGLALA
ncbi:hypothetical protein [Scytonema sp. PCC 10023]|uniref:hypothetical protein n=1 Tax=Scytonema sp. PCC 10023 TaxID=1680591 RepID=UPI0039C6B2E8